MYTEISRNHKSPERRWQEMLLKIKFYKDIFPEYQKYLDDLEDSGDSDFATEE